MDEYNNDYYSNPQGYETPQDPQYYDNQQGYDNQQPQYYDDGQQYYDNQQPQYNYGSQQQGYNNQPQGGFQNQGAPYQNQPQQFYGQPQQPAVAAAPKKKKKTKLVLAIVLPITALILIGAIVFGAVFVLPAVFITPDGLMDQQNYSEAYTKANESEKFYVLVENIAAHTCANHAVDALKDPDSFKLKNVYFDKENSILVMEIAGKNGYGGVSESYWYYRYDKDEQDFHYVISVSDLEKEEYSIYDTEKEKTEKLLKNICRIKIASMISNKNTAAKKESIKRINKFHKEDKLDNIPLIEYDFKVASSDD